MFTRTVFSFNKYLLDLHFRGWLSYAFGLMTIFLAIFMVLTRFCNQGSPVDKLKVIAPPPMNTVEQLLAVQNAISQAEQFIQDGNIILLKFRALLLSIFPQVTLCHSPCGPACLIFSNFYLLNTCNKS